VDIVTGASPELVTNVSGKPVQVITGASVDDRRTIWDLKVSKRWANGPWASPVRAPPRKTISRALTASR
jgi:hypothetical protein